MTNRDEMADLRHGNAKIVTIIRDIERLRRAIRSHDAEAAEAAWERCERWLEYVIGKAAE